MRGAVIVTSVEGTDIDIDALVDQGPQLRRAPDRSRQHGRRRAAPVGRRRRPARAGRPASPAASPSRCSPARSARRCCGWPTDLHMGLSWFVSLGDKSDVSGNDLLQFWEDDETTQRHRHVHRVVRQRPQVRPHRPAGVAAPADRGRAHRRRGDRAVGRRAVPAGRAHRGADGRRDARHRPGAGHPAGHARAAGRAAVQRPQPAHPQRGGPPHGRARGRRRPMRRSTGARRRTTTPPPLRAALADDDVARGDGRARAAARRARRRAGRGDRGRRRRRHQADRDGADGRSRRTAAAGLDAPGVRLPRAGGRRARRAPPLRRVARRRGRRRRSPTSATSTAPAPTPSITAAVERGDDHLDVDAVVAVLRGLRRRRAGDPPRPGRGRRRRSPRRSATRWR